MSPNSWCDSDERASVSLFSHSPNAMNRPIGVCGKRSFGPNLRCKIQKSNLLRGQSKSFRPDKILVGNKVAKLLIVTHCFFRDKRSPKNSGTRQKSFVPLKHAVDRS